MADLMLDDVRKTYGAGAVIHGLSLEVADGEMIVIVGPSGCGKSTLLRLVAGLERLTSGSVRIGGRAVDALEPAERDVAMVFQSYALYPHMSVRENMAYGLRRRRRPAAEIAERVGRAARLLQIEPLLDRRPRQLSGGQRQRVAMGRAIVRDPAVFLFDEPLSNLDATLRVQMRIEIRELQRRLATTSLYVTHDQVEAMTLADRLVVMNAGRAEQIGPPIALYERPETVFVAGFIGTPAMNLLAGRVSADGRSVILEGGVRVALDRPADSDRAVTLGIRPEHLVRDADGLPFRVRLTEALGGETVVHGALEGPDGAGPALALKLAGADRPRPGETLTIRPEPGALHLFDAGSGRRLTA